MFSKHCKYSICILSFMFWSQIMKHVLNLTILLRPYLEQSWQQAQSYMIFTSITFALLCLLFRLNHKRQQVDKTSNRYSYKKNTPELPQKAAETPILAALLSAQQYSQKQAADNNNIPNSGKQGTKWRMTLHYKSFKSTMHIILKLFREKYYLC